MLGVYLISTGVYAAVMLFGMFVTSITDGTDDDMRTVCRAFLCAPLWPILFVWAVITGFIWIVKTAFGKEKDEGR